MQFRLSEHDVENLLEKVRNLKEYDEISEMLRKDSRILVLFRLNSGLSRELFSGKLQKDINTISNLERGNKKITTKRKAYLYASGLKKFVELPLQQETIISNYKLWLKEDMEKRIKRALENARIGGLTLAKRLTKEQRVLRGRKGGVAAKLKYAGIHGKRHLWMEWFKKGLKIAGKRTCTGPNSEKMVNHLEVDTAIQLVRSGMKYKYEPLLRIEDRIFYPDFKTGDNIIECCYWESEDRWLYLAVKFSAYHGSGFNCILVSKDTCEKFFHLIPDFVKILKEGGLNDINAYLLPYGCQPPR